MDLTRYDMESKQDRSSLWTDQTAHLLDSIQGCADSSDFDLAVDLCTVSDVLWSIIHKQKEKNPRLYSLLKDNGLLQMSARLSDSSYKLYNDELGKTASTATDVSVEKLNEAIRDCFKSLADKGVS